MIVNVRLRDLLAQAKKVAKAAVPGHPVKELSCIYIETDGRTGVIKMTATNHEVSIRASLPAAVERDGNTAIDAKMLLGVLERLPGDDIYMELRESGQLHFKSGNTQFDIAVLAGKNYPKVDIPFPGDTVSITGLRSVIARSVFAAAPIDNGKPTLSCVNLIINGDGVRAVGCNGYCAVQAKGDPECKGGISLLIPASSLKILASLSDDKDVYELGVTGNNGVSKNGCLFRWRNGILRPVDGRSVPRHRHLIQKHCSGGISAC